MQEPLYGSITRFFSGLVLRLQALHDATCAELGAKIQAAEQRVCELAAAADAAAKLHEVRLLIDIMLALVSGFLHSLPIEMTSLSAFISSMAALDASQRMCCVADFFVFCMHAG